MNDPDHLDSYERHLSERLQRAVDDLRGPDVGLAAMARGHRLRTRRRLAYGVGGLAAVTALTITLPAVGGDWPGPGQDPSSPPVAGSPGAADPAPTSSPTASADPGEPKEGPCGESASGWWSTSGEQVRADLARLLPEGIRIGETDDQSTGLWGGTLVAGDDADFASVTLLPPPGVPGGRLSLEELRDGGPCAGGSNEPLQAVKPCDELDGHLACEEIRDEDGALVGVVTEQVEQTVVDGEEQPTDRTYVVASVLGPEGGHVELYVAEGTRADRPDSLHQPDDAPALTVGQARAILAEALWTS